MKSYPVIMNGPFADGKRSHRKTAENFIIVSSHFFHTLITFVPHVWFLTIVSFMIFMFRLEPGHTQIFIRGYFIRPKPFRLLVHSREVIKGLVV